MVLWTEEERRVLGLKPKEGVLLTILHKHGALNTVALAYESKIPRVTAMRLLASLHRRGFVAKQVLKKEIRWSISKPDLLLERFEKVLGGSSAFSTNDAVALSDVASVSVFRGAKEMLASNMKFMVAHPGERLLAVEPNASFHHYAQVPTEEWLHLNNLLKEKNIIVETILEEGHETHTAHMDEAHKDSFLSLLNETYVIPAGFLDSTTEVLIFRDNVLFLDWKQLVGVEVKNPSTVRLLRGFFTLLKRLAS